MPDIEALLILFSTWLDADMGLMVNPETNPLVPDFMTHHDLVTLFLEHGKVHGYTQFNVEKVEE